MNWLPGKTPYYEISEGGAYTVCRIGTARGVHFEAWHYLDQMAVDFQTADSAKSCCESHEAAQARAA